jgi:hypothetical protein
MNYLKSAIEGEYGHDFNNNPDVESFTCYFCENIYSEDESIQLDDLKDGDRICTDCFKESAFECDECHKLYGDESNANDIYDICVYCEKEEMIYD